jgi:hypothetical protein
MFSSVPTNHISSFDHVYIYPLKLQTVISRKLLQRCDLLINKKTSFSQSQLFCVMSVLLRGALHVYPVSIEIWFRQNPDVRPIVCFYVWCNINREMYSYTQNSAVYAFNFWYDEETDEFSLAYYDETPWHETNVLLLKMRQNSRTTMNRSKNIFRLALALGTKNRSRRLCL